MAETAGGSRSKDKTSAKKRYIRRKKERRKQRLKVATSANKTPAEVLQEREFDEESTRKPPKKRHKTVDDEESEKEMAVDEPPQELEAMEAPESFAPLSSFPLPSIPDAPSKSTLALQGIDQALVDAEFVDPAMSLFIPTGEDDGDSMLSIKTRKRLNDLGITELFAVQTRLLPFLLPPDPLRKALYQPYQAPRDICVSAPTGSGKTLAYALPIIEILSARIVIRLRALIVLPTRDLVTQVREVFEVLSKGRGLQIGIATGQQSFSHEQSQLVNISPDLKGGSSKVDILICTPGRLIEHLHETPNFSLQHLRFLVIDEADRLLAQSFQDWLTQVLEATRAPLMSPSEERPNLYQSALPFADAVAPTFLHTLPYPVAPSFATESRAPSCQKLLFSATLTRDPGKIAALNLHNPKYFIVQDIKKEGVLDVALEKFSLPSTLNEHMIICKTFQKPTMLFHLVHTLNVTNALVFTKSTESTTRLVQLFGFLEKARVERATDGAVKSVIVQAFSSDLRPNERKSILEKFKEQEIQILVCSDLISRGIDISHVSHVVSYDVPVDMRKYVHRVGRTARAGRTGDAWTLVEEQEARYFKSILREADHLSRVKRLRIGDKELSPFLEDYQVALQMLKNAYTRT